MFVLHAYGHDSVNIVYRNFYLSLLVSHLTFTFTLPYLTFTLPLPYLYLTFTLPLPLPLPYLYLTFTITFTFTLPCATKVWYIKLNFDFTKFHGLSRTGKTFQDIPQLSRTVATMYMCHKLCYRSVAQAREHFCTLLAGRSTLSPAIVIHPLYILRVGPPFSFSLLQSPLPCARVAPPLTLLKVTLIRRYTLSAGLLRNLLRGIR